METFGISSHKLFKCMSRPFIPLLIKWNVFWWIVLQCCIQPFYFKRNVVVQTNCGMSLTCSQPFITQQQRCPQGLGFTIVVKCSLACRSMKNFLLRSAFFLNSKTAVLSAWDWSSEGVQTLECTEMLDTFTSQSWDTSAWPHHNRYELPVQHSFHKHFCQRMSRKKWQISMQLFKPYLRTHIYIYV